MEPIEKVSAIKCTLIECPRDAMQGWAQFIPTEQKIAYLNALLRVGFDTLDFGSFVSHKAIPQMADTHKVLEKLDLAGCATRLLAIVANLRGAEEAVAHDQISYLGFPFSVSPTFQLRNANSTLEVAVKRVAAIQELCSKHNKQLVVYLSMGFGNPYGDAYNEEILHHWAGQMAGMGIRTLSLADTVGLASPNQIRQALETLIPQYPGISFGVHLHATPTNWKDKLAAAFAAGCTRFDGALKGIGGCPMAQDALVGNMDTEKMIHFFEEKKCLPQLNEKALKESLSLADRLFA